MATEIWHPIRKYADLFVVRMKMCLIDRMTDSVTFFMMSVGSVVQLAVVILFFHILYAQTNSIGGWSISEIYVLIGTFELLTQIAWSSYRRGGFRRLPRHIEQGKLDLLLTKPLKLRIYFIFEHVDVLFGLPSLLIGAALVWSGIQGSLLPMYVPGYLLLLCLSSVLMYAFYTMLVTINFWHIGTNIDELYQTLMSLGRYPVTIYKGIVRTLLTIAIPVSIMFSFPASALFGKLSLMNWLIMIILTLIFTLAAAWFWNAGLRRYESSSY